MAVAAIAWLGLGLRSLGLSERAERVAAAPDATPAQVEEAEGQLEDARLLNPDIRPQIVEGALLTAHGRDDEGLALLEDAVSREPENLVAWGVLANATRESDPARSRAARARLRELSPPVPDE